MRKPGRGVSYFYARRRLFWEGVHSAHERIDTGINRERPARKRAFSLRDDPAHQLTGCGSVLSGEVTVIASIDAGSVLSALDATMRSTSVRKVSDPAWPVLVLATGSDDPSPPQPASASSSAAAVAAPTGKRL